MNWGHIFVKGVLTAARRYEQSKEAEKHSRKVDQSYQLRQKGIPDHENEYYLDLLAEEYVEKCLTSGYTNGKINSLDFEKIRNMEEEYGTKHCIEYMKEQINLAELYHQEYIAEQQKYIAEREAKDLRENLGCVAIVIGFIIMILIVSKCSS